MPKLDDLNNDYDLETIEVPEPFAVGDTKIGRASFRDWQVHWRDETTLIIAPYHGPDQARPAHIYAGGRTGGDGLFFKLIPNEDERELDDNLSSVAKIDTCEIVSVLDTLDARYGRSDSEDSVGSDEIDSMGAKLYEALHLIDRAKDEARAALSRHVWTPAPTDDEAA